LSIFDNERMDSLFEAILSLNSVEECRLFFEDLCTIKEIQSMGQRLEIAERLREGMSYHEVMEQTNASSATVGRVNRCLAYGNGGYELILSRKQENIDE